METERLKNIEEVNEIIAIRKPPGDRWALSDPTGRPLSDEVIEGIVETMSEYMRRNNYHGDYRLAPLKGGGLIYRINMVEIEITKPEPKKYDLYGEF